jgi:glyoxylase-like metal-dependent hydrolase (beta-lactamase superfamily II)
MAIPLEDNFADIVGKAQRGLVLSDNTFASRAGLAVEAIQRLRAGHFNEHTARLAAPVLGLNARALIAIGQNKYAPADIRSIEGLAQFNTPFNDMTVNSYLVWDPATRDAAAFDTGADCSDMLAKIRSAELTLRFIFLTHTHGDHIFDLDRLRDETHSPAFVSSREPLDGAESIEPGRQFTLGNLSIVPRLTWGHSRGGFTWLVKGLKHPLAVVGDALFAGSMGGGMVNYEAALRTNREEIFTLPDETIICPGHGPMTTVAEERQHNPFFATKP